MSTFKRYYKLQKYYKDGGAVEPAVYKEGELIGLYQYDTIEDCEKNIVWKLVSGYICEEITEGEVQYWTPMTWQYNVESSDGTVFIKEKLIISEDGGKTFVDSNPLQTRTTEVSAGITQNFNVEYKLTGGETIDENRYDIYTPTVTSKNPDITSDDFPTINKWLQLSPDRHLMYTWEKTKKVGCHNDHTQNYQRKIKYYDENGNDVEEITDDIRWCEVLDMKTTPCTPVYDNHDVIEWKPKETVYEVMNDLIEENGKHYIKIYKWINDVITTEFKRGNEVDESLFSSEIHYIWNEMNYPLIYICEDGIPYKKEESTSHWTANWQGITISSNTETLFRKGEQTTDWGLCKENYIEIQYSTFYKTSGYNRWYWNCVNNNNSNFSKLTYPMVNYDNTGFHTLSSAQLNSSLDIASTVRFNIEGEYLTEGIDGLLTGAVISPIDFRNFVNYINENNIQNVKMNYGITAGKPTDSSNHFYTHSSAKIIFDGCDLTNIDINGLFKDSTSDEKIFVSVIGCNEDTVNKLENLVKGFDSEYSFIFVKK